MVDGHRGRRPHRAQPSGPAIRGTDHRLTVAENGRAGQPDRSLARPRMVTPETMPLRRYPAGHTPLTPTPPPMTTPPPARRRRSRHGIGIAVAAAVVAAGIGFAPWIPSLNGAGAAWTSFLPWSALLLVLLGVAALIRRAWWGLAAVVAASVVWSAVFIPQLTPTASAGRVTDLTVATQNIGAANANPVASVRQLMATGAGIIAVQELSGTAGDDAAAALDGQYKYSERVGTVGLWSQWPLGTVTPLELGLGWPRALHATVHRSDGDLSVYVVHLPSVRPGDTAARDQGVSELAALVAADTAQRVIVLGDLNTASTDPALSSLTGELADSRQSVDGGFGFSWPTAFPMTRPDHVLSRGLTVVSDQVLAADGSDHLPVVAGFSL
jgi:vancomycin resistance protein VanJ